jgi:hypothetical protein
MAAGLALVGGGAAYAATTPPYEPDPNSNGTLTFYNASGVQITSGTVGTAPMAAYYVGSATGRPTDNAAFIRAAQPNPNANIGLWNVDTLGAVNQYPLTTGPANIQTLSQSHPVNVGAGTDLSLNDFVGEFPNTDPSGIGCAYASTPAGCTNTAYQNLYQIRLLTALGSNQNPVYEVADVLVSGSTWTQVFPAAATATNTVLASSENPTVTGHSITLTAAESPAAAGSVQFMDGATNLGSPVAVNGSGVATTTTSFSSTGAHNLSAVFTPTDTSSFSPSTGTLTETVNPPSTPTTTSLAVTQDGTAGDPINLVATVAPAAAAGSVSFFDNGSSTALGSGPVPVSGGSATLNLPSGLPAGSHSIVAKFSPTDVTQFEPSQSAAQQFILQNPQVGACAQPGSQCTSTSNIQVTVGTGTLVISTPYTSSNPLDLGTMSLTPDASMLTANAPFNDIQVTDTRSGNLPYDVSAQSSPLSDGGTNPGSTIDSHNVGLTGLATTSTGGGFAGTPVYTDHAAANPPVAPGASSTAGLGDPQTIIAVDHGVGILTVHGTLTINAPISTEAGLFTGTVTFTVG